MPYICQRLSPVIWIRLNGTNLKASNGADTISNPERWAMQNLAGRGETNVYTGELVTISGKSVK